MSAPFTLTMRDETTAGDTLAELEMQLTSEEASVEEVICARVHQEVRLHNAARATRPFRGLVQPTAKEATLNPSSRDRFRRVDAEKQTDVALRAFERGQVLVLVDDRQVTELDQRVHVQQGRLVSFLKLVPLVGG